MSIGRRRASPGRLRRIRARGRARGDCRPHQAHPSRLGGDGAVLRRPDPRVPALLDAQCRLERPRRSDPRARLVHRDPFRCSATTSPQYEVLFEEKLDLFAALLKQEPVTWSGTTRPPLDQSARLSADRKRPLKTWIGVGGSPESVVRAARYDLPLMLAIIGGDPNALQTLCRPLSPRLRAVRPAGAARSACIRTAMSPRPTRKRARNCGPTTRRCATASARNAAGRRWRARSSTAKPTSGSLYVGSAGNRGAPDRHDREGARHFALRP